MYVGSTLVTSENASDVLGDGTARYEPESGTLTLENARIACADTFSTGVQYGVTSQNALRIALKGESSITGVATNEAPRIYGIIVDGKHEIVGPGMLTIDIKSNATPTGSYFDAWFYAINCLHFDPETGEGFALRDGATLNIDLATSGNAPAGCVGILGVAPVFVDSTFNVNIGPYLTQASAIASFNGTIKVAGDSRLSLAVGKIVSGSETYIYSSGIDSNGLGILEVSGSSTVDIDVNAGETHAYGVSNLNVVMSDEASLRAFATGTLEGAAIGKHSPFGDETSTSVAVSDYAVLEAFSPAGASVASVDVSGHKVGGALVGEGAEADASKAGVWDGKTVLGGADSPYSYIRIPGSATIERLAGDQANETSAQIAARAFEKCDVVVLAREDDFADALGATGLAGVLGCPIVLTDRTALSAAASQEIESLGATKAYIIGGTGAMKEQLEADLSGIGVTNIVRLWGENSYDTSLACAKEIVDLGGSSSKAVVAMSMNFQDALSVSPIAYAEGLPVVLQTWGATSADRGFTDDAREFLAGKDLIVVGGTGAISAESLSGLAEAERLWGDSGYDTSNKIAEWAVGEGILSARTVVVACGAQAPKGVDALAGAALAGKHHAPILLVNGNEEMESADLTTLDGFLADNSSTTMRCFVLGGSYVVPPALYGQIADSIGAVDLSA